jgi:hypothetical protein
MIGDMDWEVHSPSWNRYLLCRLNTILNIAISRLSCDQRQTLQQNLTLPRSG